MAEMACFAIFATVGMAAITAGILAEPANRYYNNRETITGRQKRIEELQKIHKQRQELLENASGAAVIERAAIWNLKYIPKEALGAKQNELSGAWPELKNALEQIEKIAQPPEPTYTQRAAKTLAGQKLRQYILLSLGAVLVVVSMTFFGHKN